MGLSGLPRFPVAAFILPPKASKLTHCLSLDERAVAEDNGTPTSYNAGLYSISNHSHDSLSIYLEKIHGKASSEAGSVRRARHFSRPKGPIGFYSLQKLEAAGVGRVSRLPFSIRILLEAVLRNCDGYVVSEQDVHNLANWDAAKPAEVEIPFMPARVVLQDFTGVPCVVDLAAMRDGMKSLGGDPKKINPLIPVDLVIDHSVQVDTFGTLDALTRNVEIEFERNQERYQFLRWGQQAFDNFRVVPPNTGIVHQVNLEYLAQGVFVRKDHVGPSLFLIHLSAPTATRR